MGASGTEITLDCGGTKITHAKITLDAQRITRPGFQTGGVWTGKDPGAGEYDHNGHHALRRSRPITARLYIEPRAWRGMAFCMALEGSSMPVPKSARTSEKERTHKGPRPVQLTCWHVAEMAARCSVVGHGCARDK